MMLVLIRSSTVMEERWYVEDCSPTMGKEPAKQITTSTPKSIIELERKCVKMHVNVMVFGCGGGTTLIHRRVQHNYFHEIRRRTHESIRDRFNYLD